MKIAIILGTRPEIIKMAPVIDVCCQRHVDFFIIHTNQHYYESLDKIFFRELDLPTPKYCLKVGSGKQGEQTGKILSLTEKYLLKEKPDIVLVQGDTNSTLGGALAACKIPGIKIGHIEAGLRSYDRTMPEEINRIIVDHLSHYLFAPTQNQEKILISEGINKSKIFITGNTIVDSLNKNLVKIKKFNYLLKQYNIKKNHYFLLTLHRPSNVDDKATLKEIFLILKQISKRYKLPIFFPTHPRTLSKIKQFHLKIPQEIILTKTLGYWEFLFLEKNALLILTDSGGIQEEACILHIPCVTIRNNTERPETINVGSNIISGNDERKIIKAINKMIVITKPHWKNPFGNGTAGEKIIKIILATNKSV